MGFVGCALPAPVASLGLQSAEHRLLASCARLLLRYPHCFSSTDRAEFVDQPVVHRVLISVVGLWKELLSYMQRMKWVSEGSDLWSDRHPWGEVSENLLAG